MKAIKYLSLFDDKENEFLPYLYTDATTMVVGEGGTEEAGPYLITLPKTR
jgi:hypothetical protein